MRTYCDYRKVVLVTGGSKGIGYAIANKLSQNGYELVLVARDQKALESSCQNFQTKCYCLSLDLVKENAVNALIDFLNKNYLFPNIIVHNLGGRVENDLQPLTYSVLSSSIQYNLGVAVEINNHFIPLMVRNKEGQILHISSDSAIDGDGAPGYVAAKAALNAYIRSTARFYGKNNICINGIMPGAVEFKGSVWNLKKNSDMARYLEKKSEQPIGRFGTLDEVAQFAVSLLRNYNMLTNGQVYCLNGGV